MKKLYESPVCRMVYMTREDILTASSFVPFGKEEEGDFSGGAVIKW